MEENKEKKTDKNMDKADAVEEAIKEAEEEAKRAGEEAAETAGQEAEGGTVKAEAPDGEAKEEPEGEEGTGGEDASDEDSADGGDAEKGKWFGRKKKKDPKDEQIEDLTDKLKRQMAEFDNYRKRTEKEKSQMYEIGARDVIEKILPIVDSFERGLAAVPKEQKDDPFADGMNKIYRQLMTTLEEIGVKPIEAVGQEFNPDLHNAVMHVEDDGLADNTVAEEFQKGYTYRDSVVRHSMVKVAN